MTHPSNSGYALEICCSSLESAIMANKAGADRIELCQDLENGGITPSYGLLKAVMRNVDIPVHVLIRARPGHFVYSNDEITIMRDDIINLKQCKPAGFVIGAMTTDRLVDSARCRILIEAADGAHVTFHRAFDDCVSPADMLEVIIQLGCQRLLTSGGAKSAIDGSKMVSLLLEKSKSRIEIMPGAGITPENATKLLDLGVRAIHASAKRDFPSPAWYKNGLFATSQIEADPSVVQALANIVKNYKQQSR